MSLGMAQNQQPHYPQHRNYKIYIDIILKVEKGCKVVHLHFPSTQSYDMNIYFIVSIAVNTHVCVKYYFKVKSLGMLS